MAFRSLLLLASAVASIAAVEGLLRVIEVPGLDVPHQRVYPEGYYTWYPGSRFTYRNLEQVEPPAAEVRINGDGLRGAPIERPKPEGERRILALGDSYTAAVQLPEHWNFSSLLEARLASQGQPHRVLNAGFNGAGTSHELLFLEHRGWALEPDVLVLQVTYNDLDDNVTHGAFSVDGAMLRLDPSLADPPWWKGPLLRARDFAGNHSLLFYLAYRSFVRTGAAEARERAYPAVDLFAAIVDRLLTGAAARRVPVIVVHIPHPLFLSADDERSAAMKTRLREVVAAHGQRFVDLGPALLEVHEAGREAYLPYDGHLGRDGHEAVAELLAAEVERTTSDADAAMLK